jgi:hypothetical protein
MLFVENVTISAAARNSQFFMIKFLIEIFMFLAAREEIIVSKNTVVY